MQFVNGTAVGFQMQFRLYSSEVYILKNSNTSTQERIGVDIPQLGAQQKPMLFSLQILI
jgi:hypothetical protein